MKKKEIKKVDLTLMGRFSKMVGKGIFALEISFDGLALAARSFRDFMYGMAKRSAKLADPEESDKALFKSVDDAVDAALQGR